MRTLSASLLLVTAGLTASASATTVTVGSGAGCNFNSLQAALSAVHNDPDPQPTIRVQRGLHQAASVTINRSVEVIGGYATCASPTPEPGSRSILDAGNFGRVITVAGNNSGAPIQVRLANLSLEKGRASQGGGLSVNFGISLTLEDSLVLNNEATGDGGGGIHFDGSPVATLRLVRSGVNGNRGTVGGGILCEGNGRLEIQDHSEVVGNLTDGLGGGIRSNRGCQLDIFGPVSVKLNRAAHGGGIYVSDGSKVGLHGGPNALVTVSLNRAEAGGAAGGTGAGITVDGVNSRLVASGVVLAQNRAIHSDGGGGTGGGLSVIEGGQAQFDLEVTGCAGVMSCNRFERNEAARGAAIHVGHRGTALVDNTELVDNLGSVSIVEANSSAATQPANLQITSSYFHRNTADLLVHAAGAGTTTLAHLTVAQNPLLQEVVGTTRQASESPTVNVLNSIVRDDVPLLRTAPGTVAVVRCLFVENATGLGSFGSIFLDDPLLANTIAGDLHLTAASPAIDRCFDPLVAAAHDTDGDIRGSTVSPVAGDFPTFDAGADELGRGPMVFSDGFESGDTSSWST